MHAFRTGPINSGARPGGEPCREPGCISEFVPDMLTGHAAIAAGNFAYAAMPQSPFVEPGHASQLNARNLAQLTESFGLPAPGRLCQELLGFSLPGRQIHQTTLGE
ncbi:unnamed protein product [Effrenium voratum]|nr:unnamed protein product [Effrenium voratum]